MSIRTLIRIVALSVALLLVSPLTWSAAGLLPVLVGVGLLLLTAGYLVLLAGGGGLSRWHLRYHLPDEVAPEDPSEPSPSGRSLERLEHILGFLAAKTGHFVLEAGATGLILEIPSAFDRYVEAQLPKAIPEVKLSKQRDNGQGLSAGSFFLCLGSPSSNLLRWATEDRGRQLRLHVHQGPKATLVAQTGGTRPPGHWVRLPLPRLLQRLWHHLPLWDELSVGLRLSSLLPPTDDVTVYSSRSQLHNLKPPNEYTPESTGRLLGKATDDRPLTLGYDVPLFTVGAPSIFLAQQALSDLEAGRAVVVVSSHRSVLDRIARQATGMTVRWLDPQNSQRSTHLPVVSAGEWTTVDDQTVVEAAETFLVGLDVDVAMPAIGIFCRRLIRALVTAARQRGQDLAFTDLYAVSRSTQVLRAFLLDVHNLGSPDALELLAQVDDDAGYVQAVTILSAIRTALKPLAAGPLHALCRSPFANASQVLGQSSLLLVPMTDDDFPEHDRLLSAMLDLALQRVLAVREDLNLTLHLHDPHLYRDDGGRRWIDVARRDGRVALSLDAQDPEDYTQVRQEGQEGEVLFRCSVALASSIIGDWDLPVSVTDLTELPAGTAIARLPGMPVTLKVRDR